MNNDSEAWITPVGWNRLTHPDVKRRKGEQKPLPWHRAYAQLADDDGYWRLNAGCRAVYHGLLMIALRSGRIPTVTLTLTRRLGLKVSKRQLNALEAAGLIGFCDNEREEARLQELSPRARRDELHEQASQQDTHDEAKRNDVLLTPAPADHSSNDDHKVQELDDELEALRQRYSER